MNFDYLGKWSTFGAPEYQSGCRLPAVVRHIICPLYGGGTGNGHTVSLITEDTCAEGFLFSLNIKDMTSNVNYPQWVNRLRRQLRAAKAEISEYEIIVDSWIDRCHEQHREIETLKAELERCRQLMDSRSEMADRAVNAVIRLAEKNKRLEEQLHRRRR